MKKQISDVSIFLWKQLITVLVIKLQKKIRSFLDSNNSNNGSPPTPAPGNEVVQITTKEGTSMYGNKKNKKYMIENMGSNLIRRQL